MIFGAFRALGTSILCCRPSLLWYKPCIPPAFHKFILFCRVLWKPFDTLSISKSHAPHGILLAATRNNVTRGGEKDFRDGRSSLSDDVIIADGGRYQSGMAPYRMYRGRCGSTHTTTTHNETRYPFFYERIITYDSILL